MNKVKCNQCGFIGEYTEFKTDRDGFGFPYISSCPKCDNRQSSGDASMRMFGGERPFIYVEGTDATTIKTPLQEVLHNAKQAS